MAIRAPGAASAAKAGSQAVLSASGPAIATPRGSTRSVRRKSARNAPTS
jgi:hypothetical protein